MNKYFKEAKAAKINRLKERGCERKVRYNSKENALFANRGQVPYLCKFCNGWHLTATIQKTLKLIRSKGRAIIN